METNAVCIGEKWLCYRAAREEHVFTVHSVFNRVVNITNQNRLLSVAASGMGSSSAFLTLPGNFVDLGVAAGEECVLHAGQLVIANNIINFNDVPVWKGPVTKEYRHSKVKKDNITAFKAVLDRKATPQSAWISINGNTESRFRGLNAITELRKDPSLVRNLIGLGPGLTPSGDDMLVGFLAIANHTCENRDYVSALHSAVSVSLNKTVDLSAKMLANALDCDYYGSIQDCIRDLCEGEKEDIYISAASLINIGATSGTDIACGMFFGMID